MENESWTLRLSEESPFKFVYPAFLEHLASLEIRPDHIKGRVLVIGQAGAFPEKTLIATPESRFKELREEVDVVYCCDTTYPSSPESHLQIPCFNTVYNDEIPEPSPKTAYYELSTCYTFLPKVKKNFFDTVLMFRVIDLGTQIEKSGLIKVVAPHLKTGGYFICSGGRFPCKMPAGFFEPLNLEKSVSLSNSSDGYRFSRNNGIIMQKR